MLSGKHPRSSPCVRHLRLVRSKWILIPFLGVLAIQIPVKDLLQKLPKGLL
jgi:hypothetical protein